jgi:tripartite-type tricarboxylate transporter receptor subunit TctC
VNEAEAHRCLLGEGIDENGPDDTAHSEEAMPSRIPHAAAAAALVLSLSMAAYAQTYPTRPITLVVPFAPGGGNDTLAHLVSERMSTQLGQPVVIDSRPSGAGGTLTTRQAAKAAPDGYTLVMAHSGTVGIAPSLYRHLGYDPRKDFAPVGLIASIQYAIVVNPDQPIHSIKDLIDLARKEPGRVNYASAGVGSVSHVSTELLASMAGIKLNHVPYRGSGPALEDLRAGHVTMHMAPIPTLIGSVREGRLRAIAVTGPKRSPILPDVPTVGEQDVPGYEAVLHYGILAPARTPRPIVERLNGALRAAIADDEIRKRIVDDGGDPIGSTPEEYTADIAREETKWGALVRKLDLRASPTVP